MDGISTVQPIDGTPAGPPVQPADGTLPGPVVSTEEVKVDIPKEDTGTRAIKEVLIEPFTTSDGWVGLVIGLSALVILGLILLSIFYVFAMFADIQKAGLQGNTLNIESVETRAILSKKRLFLGKYNYLPFVVLPVLVFLFSIGAIYAMLNRTANVHPVFMVVLVLFLVYSLVLAVIAAVLYFRVRKQAKPVKDRIRLFNLYVNKRMSKDLTFLSDLLNVNTNPLLSKDVVRDALLKVPAGISAENLAEYFFTINMYSHFQKLGANNPYFVRAMELFLPLNIINVNNFRPSDYLYSRITFIEDVSTTYIGTASTTSLSQDLFKNSKVVNDAAVLANEWTSEATNMANSFYTRDVYRPFVNTVVMMALFQIILLLPLIWVFSDKDRRAGVFTFLATLSRAGKQ